MRKFYSLLTCFLIVFCGPLSAQEIDFGDQKYKVIGQFVAKSSAAHLASLSSDTPTFKRNKVYIPAGTRLDVTEFSIRDNARNWHFAVTEYGTPVFVRRDGTHYFGKDRFSEVGSVAAIVSNPFNISTKKYGKQFLSSSEIYRAELLQGENLRILVDQNKISPDVYRGPEWVEIDNSNNSIVIVDVDSINRPEPFQYFKEASFSEILNRLFNSATNLSLSEEDKAALTSIFDTQSILVKSKDCRDQIEIPREIDVGLDAEFKALLGSISAQFGITAGFISTSNYPTGTAFQNYRYFRGDEVLEIWETKFYDSCGTEPKSTTLSADQSANVGDGHGIITSFVASQMKLPVTPANKLPAYSCKDQFFLLLNNLTALDSRLTKDAAYHLIATHLIFNDSNNLNTCTNPN